jgi:hypothetical protein
MPRPFRSLLSLDIEMSQVVHFCSLAPDAFVWMGNFREYLCLKGEGGKKKRG